MTIRKPLTDTLLVNTVRPDRPYFEVWLRRMNRHFAASGRLSQTAVLMAAQYGETQEVWSARLRKLLDGTVPPTIELITRIDAILAPEAKTQNATDPQATFLL